MKNRIGLALIVAFVAMSSMAVVVGELPDTTPIATAQGEHKNNVSLATLGKVQEQISLGSGARSESSGKLEAVMGANDWIEVVDGIPIFTKVVVTGEYYTVSNLSGGGEYDNLPPNGLKFFYDPEFDVGGPGISGAWVSNRGDFFNDDIAMSYDGLPWNSTGSWASDTIYVSYYGPPPDSNIVLFSLTKTNIVKTVVTDMLHPVYPDIATNLLYTIVVSNGHWLIKETKQ